MDIEFNNLKELKERIEPAINVKLKELKEKNFNSVTNEDIWNYLKTKWKKTTNLTLYDIVNDILTINNEELENYAIKRSENHD